MATENSRVPAGGVVVIGALSKATQDRLEKAADGKLAKVADSPPTHVVETSGSDLRKLSERINKVVGMEGIVAPMLADGEGNRLLPTGTMQVRFKSPPSDDLLADFAERHKIELAQRNKWSPQQAEFAVRTDDVRYFPDVAAELEKDQTVMSAWPDVRAAFRREKA
ncbi:hypothetical protein JQ629_18400 [Bradyrhizobium sp. AUGA SZCCT0222]|uniref:hypothetical protein n=1 Tax=Bradyrhizobium sp. AUGA SZCCT0222 TaxID=2807668 RepID=UPI001BA50BA7|nr:hypothetical protein [Bradyrhizobium sp. AUGA SZCCT0222]MBR1269486.1 hypothetical protein [Bradyrhizobium sp. AUGA SZCCT0222]